MATFSGHNGIIQVSSNTIAEVNGWTIEESADTFEDTELTDTAKSFKSGQTSWTASAEAHWDDTDTNGQEALTIGSEVTLNLGPEGTGSGAYQYSGSAIVTSISVAVAKGATVTRNIGFQGTGALTKGTY